MQLQIIKLLTRHFLERFYERFEEADLPRLERTIELAIKNVEAGKKVRYTHPAYGFTVVVEKVGLNGAHLITCWKNGVEIAND